MSVCIHKGGNPLGGVTQDTGHTLCGATFCKAVILLGATYSPCIGPVKQQGKKSAETTITCCSRTSSAVLKQIRVFLRNVNAMQAVEVKLILVKVVSLVKQPTSKPGEGESANKTLSGASGSSFLAPLLWSAEPNQGE